MLRRFYNPVQWRDVCQEHPFDCGAGVSLVYNKKVAGLFGAYIQWLVATVCSLYILIIGIYGYTLQPLVDFRSFPVGTSLVPAEEDGEDAEFEFVYEKKESKEPSLKANCPIPHGLLSTVAC